MTVYNDRFGGSLHTGKLFWYCICNIGSICLGETGKDFNVDANMLSFLKTQKGFEEKL